MPAPKSILPPRARGYVVDYDNNGLRTEITDDITNWNDLSLRQEREGFSGVFVSVQNALEVCRKGKAAIQGAFHANALAMNMWFQILRRGPKDFNYRYIHSMQLKPGTYEERKDYISIEGQALTFEALVKSVGKTKYDIPIAATDDSPGLDAVNWRYTHNEVFVVGDWTIPENDEDSEGISIPFGDFGRRSLSATLNDAKMPIGGIENDFKSQIYSNLSSNADHSQTYFFLSDRDDQEVTITIDFKGTYTYPTATADSTSIVLSLGKYDAEGNGLGGAMNKFFFDNDKTGTINIDYQASWLVVLNKGERIRLELSPRIDPGEGADDVFKITEFNKFTLTYKDKSKRTDIIPAITPLTLANALLSKMAGGDPAKTYTAAIEADTDNPWTFNHYLVAAESIRGFEKANFHANFNDFIDYMNFLGYEYETDEDTRIVHFHKRSYFFNPNITAINLKESEVANLVIKGNDEYAYSTVRVGYEKPDIEGTNGRFAVCGAFDYSTDYRNPGSIKDSSLEIMCPYKADPVLIETLSWTRGEKTTDQKADNDIFMLAGEISGDYIVETRQAQYVVTDPDITGSSNTIEWYNVPYIPYFITKRNSGKIGIAVKNLTFTGTDAYRDATLSGVVTDDMKSNIAITDGLFLPITYEFDAGTLQGLPPIELRAGLVKFVWNGKQYRGYIKDIAGHIIGNQGEAWVLYAR